MEGEVAADGGGYQPPPEFVEDRREPLIDIDVTDSTELWLIQWPHKTPPDFHGSEVTLKLHHNGKLGTFEGSSGKEYDVVSYASQEPDATVFLSSSSGLRIVGKISRRVSLIHYPDPSELEKFKNSNVKQMYQNPAGTSLANASNQFSTPSRSIKVRGSRSSSKYVASSHGSRQRGASTEAGESSRPGKRVAENSEHIHSGSGVTSEHSRGRNLGVSSVSMGNSSQKSPKKKRKNDKE